MKWPLTIYTQHSKLIQMKKSSFDTAREFWVEQLLFSQPAMFAGSRPDLINELIMLYRASDSLCLHLGGKVKPLQISCGRVSRPFVFIEVWHVYFQ